MSTISKMIEDFPLYKKVEIDINDVHPNAIHGMTYNSYCPISKSKQTFELQIYPDRVKQLYGNLPAVGSRKFIEVKIENHEDIPYDTQHYKGICKCCNQYKQDLVLNIFCEEPQPKNNNFPQSSYFIRKIGQYPPFDIKPELEISKFLSKEDLEYYKRGLMNLSSNYGIGAFAYFRRITENEIKNICLKLSELDIDGADGIKGALDKYYDNHQMSNLIEEVYKFLPSSLKQLGDNPLQLLYDQLSGGIHKYSEEECYDKAIAIDILLKFVVNKLNEEESQKKGVIEAIKKLKGKS
jgi:hypothetical protein